MGPDRLVGPGVGCLPVAAGSGDSGGEGCGPIGYRGEQFAAVQRPRDPWAPFRIGIALSIGLYALRAALVTTPLGAIPGYVLLLLVLGALALALGALLWPGRVVFWRETAPGPEALGPGSGGRGRRGGGIGSAGPGGGRVGGSGRGQG